MDHSFSSNSCKYVQDETFILKYCNTLEEKKEILSLKFEKLFNRATEECRSITKENVMEESTANIGRYQRWLDTLYKAQTNLNNLKSRLYRLESELYHYYRNNSDISDKIKSDSATQRYIEGNICRNCLKEYILNNEALVEFIQGTVKNLHNRNFAIKNIIEAWSNELGL